MKRAFKPAFEYDRKDDYKSLKIAIPNERHRSPRDNSRNYDDLKFKIGHDNESGREYQTSRNEAQRYRPDRS